MEKNKKSLPQSVIDYYTPFVNTKQLKKVNILGVNFEIDDKYEILDSIGKGSYGTVVAGRDTTLENKFIAIKKIENAFEHKLFAKRTLREIRILRLLKHENVCSIINIMLPKSRENFDDLYIVYELMETDLFTVIKSPQTITEEHSQFFLYQILVGLKFIHSANIIHRDIKSRNILLNANCDLKICDFGLARPIIPEIKKKLGITTNYVVSRWYRAPEILFQFKDYDYSVDVWATGCIFAEILNRKPFLQGKDTKNQIELILDLLGNPDDSIIEKIPSKTVKKFLSNQPKKNPKKIESLFPNVSPIALDLLKKMLKLDPNQRISVEQALDHPFLDGLHCFEDEEKTVPVSFRDFEFENYEWTIEQLKDMIYEEILLYHFEDEFKKYEKSKKENKSFIQHIINSDNNKLDNSDDDLQGNVISDSGEDDEED